MRRCWRNRSTVPHSPPSIAYASTPSTAIAMTMRAARDRPPLRILAIVTPGRHPGRAAPSRSFQSVDRAARILRFVAQPGLDAQELVVLRDAVGAARRAGLDLAGVGGNCEVGDEGVLRLAAAVRDDALVPVPAGQLHRLECLAHRADLVQLDEDRVAHVF